MCISKEADDKLAIVPSIYTSSENLMNNIVYNAVQEVVPRELAEEVL